MLLYGHAPTGVLCGPKSKAYQIGQSGFSLVSSTAHRQTAIGSPIVNAYATYNIFDMVV